MKATEATMLVVIMVVVCGCTPPKDVTTDYEDTRRAAVDAWEEVIGPVSDECYERTKEAMVTETGRFPESCMPPLELGQYIGCYMPTEIFGLGGDMIFIYEGRNDLQKADTAVHEYTHLLSYCEFGGDELLMSNPDEFIATLVECAAVILAEEEPPDECVEIPGDYFHLDERLWDRIQTASNGWGMDTVEAVGCSNL